MQENNKIAPMVLGMLLAACFLRSVSALADAPGDVSSRLLEQRMNEIITLQQKIDHQTAQAQALYSRLADQFALVVAEIRDECRQRAIISYAQAIRWQTLDHHLSLAQQLHSYMRALDRKIQNFKNEYQRLGFFYQEAVDDLKIIKALPSLDITAFMAETGRTIAAVRRDLRRYLVDSRDIEYIHTVRIWKLVAAGTTITSRKGPG